MAPFCDQVQVPRWPYALTLGELGEMAGEKPDLMRARAGTEALVVTDSGRMGVNPDRARRLAGLGAVKEESRVLVFASLKGGVGKTTSAVTVASRAAQLGVKTCLLDLDSQASATFQLLGLPPEPYAAFCDVWEDPVALLPAAIQEVQPGFGVLPSSLDNAMLDIELMKPDAQRTAVSEVCRVAHGLGYELVVVDCPPSLGAAVISSVCAARTVVIPVTHDAFAQKGLRLTLDEIGSICRAFALTPPRTRILTTMHDQRLRLCASAFNKLVEDHGDRVVRTPIRTSSEYARKLAQSRTVFSTLRQSRARHDYANCFQELVMFE